MPRTRKLRAFPPPIPRSDHPLTTADERPAALYHRVSSLDQRPELARDELRAFARARGLTVLLDVEETGSGARSDRPGLHKVMEAARRGTIRELVCWKLDRLGSSTLDLHSNAAALESFGVRLSCVTQAIDTGTPSGKLLFTVLAAVAEFERDTIRERTRLGLQAARKRGVKLGRPKFSHPTVEQVVALKGDGKSWRSIAATLGCSINVARLRYREGAKVPSPVDAA